MFEWEKECIKINFMLHHSEIPERGLSEHMFLSSTSDKFSFSFETNDSWRKPKKKTKIYDQTPM